MLACAAPTWLAWNAPPSATFLNQALSFGLWGWFVLLTASGAAHLGDAARAARGVLMALAFCAAATAWSWGPGALPGSLALSLIGALAAGSLVLLHGAALGLRGAEQAGRAGTIVFVGLLVAGLGGSVTGVVQVFQPEWADGQWIAVSSIAGRAVGNLRQPNHLSSVLLWACVALVALHTLLGWRIGSTAALGAWLVVAVVLTASRTGLVSVLLLAAWGALDRRLSRPVRLLLLAAPVVYAVAWWALAAWGDASSHRFGGAARLAETDISGSRFGIWSDTLTLIRAHPWSGVGMGEFNLAWSLSVMPNRPTAFFDHAHNLPLQLAVELGLPLALAVLALLIAGLWQVASAALRAEHEGGTVLRCALMVLLMIGLHSLLEYPLWYAYFLLPTLWVWGLALGVAARTDPVRGADGDPAGGRTGAPVFVALGAALVVATALVLLDYRRAVVIFSAGEGAAPLAQRIAEGRRSLFFAHHAAYAEATTAAPESATLEPFASAGHYLLDTRLMTAWAEALHRAGQVDAARHVAARLREFRNPASAEFFAVCAAPATLPPWNCEPPRQVHDWRAFAR